MGQRWQRAVGNTSQLRYQRAASEQSQHNSPHPEQHQKGCESITHDSKQRPFEISLFFYGYTKDLVKTSVDLTKDTRGGQQGSSQTEWSGDDGMASELLEYLFDLNLYNRRCLILKRAQDLGLGTLSDMSKLEN